MNDDFRRAMSRFASGVTIVTVRHGELVHGMTATAFFSLSLEPPLIAVAIARKARLHGLLPLARRFAVNVLAESQQALSRHFAGMPQQDVQIALCGDEVPLLDGALAHLVCELRDVLPGGDHSVYVGEVTRADGINDCKPLVYFAGRYCAVEAIPERCR